MSATHTVVLDTSAYSHFRVGHPAVLALLSSADTICIPTIVLGELDAAFRRGSRRSENDRALGELLSETFVSVVDVNANVARHYGRLHAALRSAGTPVPANDVWIAACTFHVSGYLATFDSDFSRIRGLEHTVFDWA